MEWDEYASHTQIEEDVIVYDRFRLLLSVNLRLSLLAAACDQEIRILL